MENQLRLAERRGIFTRRRVSRAVAYGVQILQHIDNQRKIDLELSTLKAALVSYDPTNIKTLYPDYFDPEDDFLEDGSEEANKALLTGEAVEDYSAVSWMSPKDAEAETEFNELMALSQAMAANSSVSVPGEVSDGG